MSTWRDLAQLGYYGEVNETHGVVRVVGFGVACTYAIDDDAALASLLDPDAHAERRFQHTQPAAHAARVQLELAGYTVQRVDASADTFIIAPPQPTLGAGAVPATPAGAITPNELIAYTAAQLGGASS